MRAIKERQYFGHSERNIQVVGVTTNDRIVFIFSNPNDRIEVKIYCNTDNEEFSDFISRFYKCVEFFKLDKSAIAQKLVEDSVTQFSGKVLENSRDLILTKSPIELMLISMKQAIMAEHSE